MTKLEKATEALKTIGEATVASVFEEEYDSIKEAIVYFEEELKNAEANYKALEYYFKNSVDYSTKLQEELNGLKKDVALYFEWANNDEITEEALDEFNKIRNKLISKTRNKLMKECVSKR